MSKRRGGKRNNRRPAEAPKAACVAENGNGADVESESQQLHTAVEPSSGEQEAQIVELRRQLAEKERLVAALTDRLEQAAEQLDRLHRTGVDRALRVPGVPAELVNAQRELTERLKEAVEQWENMQAGAALGRIEVQLAELRDLIVSFGKQAASPRASVSAAADCRTEADQDRDGEVLTASSKEAADGWEALKARILSGEAATTERAESSGPSLSAALASAAGQSAGKTPSIDVSERSGQAGTSAGSSIAEVPAPEPIDPETATLEQLREAVESRDAYISYLLKKLRLASVPQLPPDWQSLQNVPDQLRARLEELERRLNESVRLAEVDLSLERARLARQEAALRQREAQLEQKLKQYGLQLDDEAEAEQQPTRDRRWLKFLVGRRRSSSNSASDA